MDNQPQTNDLDQMIRQAYHALSNGNGGQAWKIAASAASLFPHDERPWLLLAAMASPEKSIEYLEHAVDLNPQSESAKKGLAWARARLETGVPPVQIQAATPVEPPSGSIIASLIEPSVESAEEKKGNWLAALKRISSYTLVRGATLFLSVCVSIFLIVYIANLGGYMDTIQKGLISENISAMLMSGWLKEVPLDQRQPIIDATRASMEASYGLDKPYLQRTANWFLRGISLNWGRARTTYPVSTVYYNGAFLRAVETDDIRTLILAYLPRTMLLFGLSNFGLFIVSIFIALPLALKPRRWTNRFIMWLAPTSSIPSWLVGFIMLAIIYSLTGNSSFQLGYNSWSASFDIQFVPGILRGMLLPFLAIVFSKFFQCVYTLRNYFMIYSKEDYVDLAVAKGLPARQLQRRYILRPTLPAILTNFVLIFISIWQECIAVEYFFNIGGIGGFFMTALNNNDIMSVVAMVSTFAYFLAAAVFLLDIVYAVIDPRVKIGETKQIERKSRGLLVGLGLRQLFGRKQHKKVPSSSILQPGTLFNDRPKLSARVARTFNHAKDSLRSFFNNARQELKQYPSIAVGLCMILILAIISISTVIIMPYSKAISLWRGDDKVWIRNPREVPPAWTNFFRANKLPETIDLYSSSLPAALKEEKVDSSGYRHVIITYPVDFPYKSLPQDVVVMFQTQQAGSTPMVEMTWITPDGRLIPLDHFGISQESTWYLSQDKKISSAGGLESPVTVLFSPPGGNGATVQPGKYFLRLDFTVFEPQTSVGAELIVYGQVYGLAGTDRFKRDLTLVLLWGLAVALSFGILAAVGTTLTSVTLAAIGAWFGGWVDGLIQRITEINMVLPMLPVAIMIFFLYSKSFWVILGVTVGLSIFGNQIKHYRAMFLQVMELPYIEAAVSYGAPAWRIIFQYMIPRIRNVIIPQLMVLVPSYVFFEATLTFLGVSDPTLPTLGKLLFYMITQGGFTPPAYMIVETVFVFTLISIGFVFIGYGLEQSYNDKTGI